MKPVTTANLREMKAAGEKIAVLTAYDYSFSALLDRAGVDIVLVGDSLGMVIQGHDSTLPVTMDDMVYHNACVARGCPRALRVVDMPFGSFQISPAETFRNAARLLGEGGAQVVKLEGGEPMVETVRYLSRRGIPVCAHVGLTPQSVHQLGGFRVQGRGRNGVRMLEEAKRLEEAGASLMVLEAIPSLLAAEITAALNIPTIGIGAGPDTDGQVLVLQDMLGIFPDRTPKFARDFMQEGGSIEQAVQRYIQAVKEGEFPGPEHGYS